MGVLPSLLAIWVCITSTAVWDRHLSCHTAQLKGSCIFHTFFQGMLFSCVAYVYLTAVMMYTMCWCHIPSGLFWKHTFTFFKECNRSLTVKPRVRISSGAMPQAAMDLAKGMSLVPLQHLDVSPPKQRANPEYTNAFHHIQDNLFLLLFHLCCTTMAALPSGFVSGGILFRNSHSPCKLCYTTIIAACFQHPCQHSVLSLPAAMEAVNKGAFPSKKQAVSALTLQQESLCFHL